MFTKNMTTNHEVTGQITRKSLDTRIREAAADKGVSVKAEAKDGRLMYLTDDGTARTPGECADWLGVSVETTLPAMLDDKKAKTLRQAGRMVAHWTEKRDELVKEAVAAGGSYREVSEAVGLSHTAVKFIAKGRP